jgi:RNA polymerase sigma factor (sigma-70 family)
MATPIPTDEEYVALARQWKTAVSDCNDVVRNRVAAKILDGLNGLIWSIANAKTKRFDFAFTEDAVSEAKLIILKGALKNWNEKKAAKANCKFSSYMITWIMSGIQRFIEKSFIVSLPVNGRKDALKELRETGTVSSQQKAYIPSFVYWDAPATKGDGESRTLRDVIYEEDGSAENSTAIEDVSLNQKREFIRQLLDSLNNERMATVINLTFSGYSQSEIGAQMGISKARVSQLYISSLSRMQSAAKRSSWWPSIQAEYGKPPEIVDVIKTIGRKSNNVKTAKRRAAALRRNG